VENHDNPQSGEPVSWRRLRTKISLVRVKSITAMPGYSANLFSNGLKRTHLHMFKREIVLSFLSTRFIEQILAADVVECTNNVDVNL
jgi:hypothetical protein